MIVALFLEENFMSKKMRIAKFGMLKPSDIARLEGACYHY